MKILHIISSVNPVAGGPIEFIKQLGRVLGEKGLTYEIACLDAPNAPWLKAFPHILYALGPGVGKYGYTGGYLRWLKSNLIRYDCILLSGIWQFTSIGLWRVCKSEKRPYFLFIHGMLDPWFRKQYPFKHLKKSLYWMIAEHRVLRDARAVLFTSEQERRLARRSFYPYRCNEKVVHYGTAPPDVDKETQRTEFLKHFQELNNRRILLFMGRIHEKKGIDILIQAFCKIGARDDSLHLVIAGPDQEDYRKKLEIMAAARHMHQRITWTGMLSGNLKWGAIYCAEAFVLPSHQENFGISVVEALACGVPVLITDKVNIWEKIAAEDAGIVDTDNLAGVHSLLDRWLRLNTGRRHSMGKNALQCFHRHFDIRKAVVDLLETVGQSGDT